MNNRPSHLRLAILAIGWLVQVTLAQPLPSFKKLNTELITPRSLRAAPVMLSRFPTTFSIAVCAERNQLRTVDINGRVWQWSIDQNAKPVLVTETNCEPACSVLSKDARWLAFAEPSGHVVVWQIDAGRLKFRDSAKTERTVTLTFSSDARFLAGVTVDGTVRIWDVTSGKVIRELQTKQNPVQAAAFSPNAELLAVASFSPEIKLFQVQSKTGLQAEMEPRLIHVGSSRITTFAFSPDGKHVAIATGDGGASVYELATGHRAFELGSHPFAIWSIVFEPSGQSMAAGSWDGTIKIWDAKTWKLLQSLKTHEESVAAMNYDSELGLVSAGLDGRLLFWLLDVPSIRPSGMIAGRKDSVWVAAYSPDCKKLFVGGREKRFELWDMEYNELLIARDGHATTRCAAFSPNGKSLATGGDDGTISLWDSTTGEVLKTLRRHRGAVSAVIFADGGQTLVSGCDGGYLKLWDTTTGQEKVAWKEHQQQIYCAELSPDGKWLVTGGGNWTTGDPGELIVWDFKAGRIRSRVEGHTLAVWSIAFIRDGTSFASSDSSGAVKIWNTQTLKQEHNLQHAMWVRGLSISPDGSVLAVGRGDGSVRLWDTGTWTEKAACDGHTRFTFSLQFAPNGETLVAGGEDGTVFFWPTGR